MNRRRNRTKSGYRCSVILALAAVALLQNSAGHAQADAAPPAPGNLNINPKRVTFDRTGRSASIYVFNQGKGTATFDVQLVDRLMLPSGEILPLTDAAARPELKPVIDRLKSAAPLLLVTPRRVTLSGGVGQTIRVRATSDGDLPPGEYRTHLTVTGLPPADVGVTAESAAAGQRNNQLSFQVNTVIGLSIPIIIRVGPVDVRAGIANARIETRAGGNDHAPRVSVLSFDLQRLGVNSIFGDLVIRGDHERGDKEPLGAVRGIAVYPEIDRRLVKVALRRVPAPGEQIEILFRDDDVNPGKQLARVTLNAP